MKKIINIIALIAILASTWLLTPGHTLAQAGVACEVDVVVQADDWLSKLADKFYGDVLAFPVIADATNAKSATDDSYATIENVDLIEPGWKLCIPSSTDAEAMLGEPVAPAPASDDQITIALSLADMAFPFFVFMETQIRAEAESLGNIEIVTLDGQNQVPKQTADMEAAIAKEFDGVLISPITADAMAPAVQQVVDAGIPVVTIDRSVSGVDVLAHVGADNVLGGEEQGKAIVELFPDGATIFELTGEPGSSPAIDRSAGLHNIIDGVDNIEVACQQTARFRRELGLSVTENCLSATPNPDVIVAANDEMALGAAEAVKALGLQDQVKVIGYDALPEALLAIQSGDLYATIEQLPGEQSRVGLRTLVDFIRGGQQPASEQIFISPKLITPDNLNEAERIGEIQ